MARKFFSKFWVSVTVVITAILLAILFPPLLDKYGMVKAILWSLLLVFGMFLAYVRGYWVCQWLCKKKPGN